MRKAEAILRGKFLPNWDMWVCTGRPCQQIEILSCSGLYAHTSNNISPFFMNCLFQWGILFQCEMFHRTFSDLFASSYRSCSMLRRVLDSRLVRQMQWWTLAGKRISFPWIGFSEAGWIWRCLQGPAGSWKVLCIVDDVLFVSFVCFSCGNKIIAARSPTWRTLR